ncbi:MAG: DUF2259 domain-containing protein [Candidatus Aegiribacteria sp.]|nr:DUF2259 domain-containing protein [Candidatus Aegiribacteria sp.]
MNLKEMMAGLPVCCLLLISAPVLSEDQAWFRLHGFSEDGAYAAWEMGGIQDGSGFQWIQFEILKTNSSLPEDGFCHVWDEYVDELPERADMDSINVRIDDLCREFRIIPGNTGDPLIYHPVTDLGVRGDTVTFCLEYFTPNYNSGELILVLTTLPVNCEQDYPDWFPSPVTPVLGIIEKGEKHLLFTEDTLPELHRMNFGYGIAAVYSNPTEHNSLLVVLHSVRPGFEGSDGRFRVVSGSF